MENLSQNLSAVRREIADICATINRDSSTVKIVVASKYVDAKIIAQLHQLGVNDFGENRVENCLEKISALPHAKINWHFIGHLQRNKAKKIIPAVKYIHSVDNENLAEILAKRADELSTTVEILLEVNVGGEENKYGLPIENFAKIADLARCISALPSLSLRGLMTMAPLNTDNITARPFFRKLAQLRDELQNQLSHPLPELSMGMSNDFPAAIREGATMIRIGSRLFA